MPELLQAVPRLLAHAVNHQLLWSGGGRNDEAARAHAEAIYAPTIHLGNKAVLGGREILAPAVLVVILYLVDELGWMLQAHTYGDAFASISILDAAR